MIRIDRIRRRIARFLQREAYIGSSNYLDKTVADLAKKVGVEFDEEGHAWPVQAQEEAPAKKPEEKSKEEKPKEEKPKEEAPKEEAPAEEAPAEETPEEAPAEEAPKKEKKFEPLPEDAMSLEQRIKKIVRDVVQKTRDQKKQPAPAE